MYACDSNSILTAYTGMLCHYLVPSLFSARICYVVPNYKLSDQSVVNSLTQES
jgi:hypothetical protein